MKTLLYVTDLYYKAKGRNYYEEDLFITAHLKKHFNILIGHPQQVISYIESAPLIVFRNTGAVLGYQQYFQEFLKVVKQKNISTFNSFDGKADIKGKQYLLQLTELGYPVIPTVDLVEKLEGLPQQEAYIVKLLNGADSIGMEKLGRKELLKSNPKGKLIQPYIDFDYEVSFYYLNNSFQYALYAPNKERRWELKEYEPTREDLEFAKIFIDWNEMKHGITRVDACRQKDGFLQLVELEDLNPYLSLDLLSNEKQASFINNFVKALEELT